MAHAVSRRRWVPAPVMQDTVRRLCEGRFLGRKILAHLLGRNADDLLKRTLNPMVQAQELLLAYPSASDPRQAYTTRLRNTSPQ